MNKEYCLKMNLTNRLNCGRVQPISQIPAGGRFATYTREQAICAPAGIPSIPDYSIEQRWMSNWNFSIKLAPAIFGQKAGPERIGTTMKTIRESTTGCKINNLLRYFHLLNQARQVGDILGKRLMKVESKRIREKYLFLESIGMFEER